MSWELVKSYHGSPYSAPNKIAHHMMEHKSEKGHCGYVCQVGQGENESFHCFVCGDVVPPEMVDVCRLGNVHVLHTVLQDCVWSK